jgi:hypothetical protein
MPFIWTSEITTSTGSDVRILKAASALSAVRHRQPEASMPYERISRISSSSSTTKTNGDGDSGVAMDIIERLGFKILK